MRYDTSAGNNEEVKEKKENFLLLYWQIKYIESTFKSTRNMKYVVPLIFMKYLLFVGIFFDYY